jgi:large subunit ribosomal protein L16
MLMPKRVKFRKSQRGIMKGPATRGNRVSFGDYGLMSLEHGWLMAREIEARASAPLTRWAPRAALIRVFPHKSISAKPAEVSNGHGQGRAEYWAAVIKPGTILFELSGIGEEFAKQIFNNVAHKMSLRCKLVMRRHA